MSFSQKDISIIFIIFSRYLKSILKKMNYINVENLTKTYGIITLFEDISFNINEGDKIAIVAKNGS